MSSSLQRLRTARNVTGTFLRALLATALVATTLVVTTASPALAASSISHVRSAPGVTTVGTNQSFVYRLELACSSNTDDCGVTTITDPLPDAVEYVGIDLTGAAEWSSTYDADAHTVTITKTDGSAFQDGSSLVVAIEVRVLPDFDPSTGPFSSQSTTESSNDTPPAPSNVVDVSVVNTPGWGAVKSQISPAADVRPALDAPITYTVGVCGPTVGNVPLEGLELVDTLPAGAQVIDPAGGVVDGGVITWPLVAVSQADLAAHPEDEYCQTFSPSIQYNSAPDGPFAEDQTIENRVDLMDAAGFTDATVACGGTGPAGNCQATVTSQLTIATAAVEATKRGDPTISENGILTYPMSVGTETSNSLVPNVVATDLLPAGMRARGVDVTRGDAGFEIWASVDGGNNWVEIASQNPGGNGRRRVRQSDFDSAFGNDAIVDGIQVRFLEGSTREPVYQTQAGLKINIDLYASTIQGAAPSVGGAIENCLDISTSVSASARRCHSTEVTVDQSVFGVTKAVTPESVLPGQEQTVGLTMFADSNNATPLVDPVLYDLLPAGFEYVGFTGVVAVLPDGHSAVPAPNVEIIDNHEGSGRQLVRFSWSAVPPEDATGTDGVSDPEANSFAFDWTLDEQLAAEDFADASIGVEFTVQPAAGTPAGGGYDNDGGGGVSNQAVTYCRSKRNTPSEPLVDTDDLDGDGSTADVVCANTATSEVLISAALSGSLWDDGHPDLPHVDATLDVPAPSDACPQFPDNTGFTRFPCAAQSLPGQAFPYLLEIINQGNTPLEDYWLYDILPHVGDVGVNEALADAPRGSAWTVQMTGPLTINDLPDGTSFTIEYSRSNDPCRNEMALPTSTTPWPADCEDDWTGDPSAWADDANDPTSVAEAWSQVRSFRVHIPFDEAALAGGQSFTIDVPALIPDGSPLGSIAWNSFAHRATNALTTEPLLPAAPRVVGIRIPGSDALGHRVGNLVWLDTDNDGVADEGESGVAGLTVQLLTESGDEAGLDDDDDVFLTTTTDENGVYFFPVIGGDDTYYVAIPANQGAVTIDAGSGPIEIDPATLQSSTPTNPVSGGADNLDDGAAAEGYITATAGFSVTDGAPTGEADSNVDPARDAEAYVEGAGSADLDDADSDLSIDLGLVLPQRLGGLLWFDGAPGDGGFDNGEADSNESDAPVVGATVHLINDLGEAGVYEPAIDTVAAATTTDDSGNYLFAPAAEGSYFIGVMAGGPLTDFQSSSPTTNAGNGQDDVDDGAPSGIYASLTNAFTFTGAGNPTDEGGDFEDATAGAAEADANASDSGFYLDPRSDLTLDFGFVAVPEFEIGNLVWNDIDGDGLAEDGEPGIAGVTVELWSADEDGAADERLASVDTDDAGHYSFAELDAGDYLVVIPSDQSEATDATALTGWRPVTANIEGDPDGDVDNNQNGVSINDDVAGLASGVLTLGNGPSSASEPTNEALRADSDTDDESTSDTDDLRSNLSVDFGFTQNLRLGGIVWRDEGVSDAADDDAELTEGEGGLAGVLVALLDTDGATLAVTVTDDVGAYWFDNLQPGPYQVGLPADQSGADDLDGDSTATEGLISSQATNGAASISADPEAADNDDDGDPTDGFLARSGTVNLANTTEPVEEADSDVDPARNAEAHVEGAGALDLADNNSNLRIDFGLVSTPVLSVGNRVWADWDDDGTHDENEPGIAGVRVELWPAAVDRTAPTAAPLQSALTDDDGYYFFTEIATEGDYLVVVTAANFVGDDAPLRGLAPSTPVSVTDENGDELNDGRVDADSGGVASGVVTLTFDEEPTDETDLGPEPAGDDPVDFDAQSDDRSNVTVDFGFHTMSLGNRVFLDDDADGVQGDEEPGRPGVAVELWSFVDNELGELLAATTTDDTGHYLFTSLTAGDYVVRLPASNAESGGALFGYVSTVGNGLEAPDADDDPTDQDDNGNPLLGSIVQSEPVTLSPGTEPTGETDLGVLGDLAGDPSSNLTVDFGFIARPGLELGNRVFLDVDADGVHDEDEPGIDDVTVELFDVEGELIAFDVTTNGGYYSFPLVDEDGNLAEGDYVVRIPQSNFDEPTDALWGLFSSPDPELGAPDPDVDETDRDDNGADPTEPFGDVDSAPTTLTDLLEPLGETDFEGPTFNGDENANLTVDFGFTGLTIGNLVFLDNDDDAVFTDEVDAPFAGVTLRLLDELGEPVTRADGGSITATTDDNGIYTLAVPTPGAYMVEVEASNFAVDGPLASHASSDANDIDGVAPGVDDDASDFDDNGSPMGDTPFTSDAVRSSLITLDFSAEPIDEEQSGASADLGDASQNQTVDFGFYAVPGLELGNQVFFDNDNDGLDGEGDEPAPAGVLLNLLDADGSAITNVDGEPVTTTTDAAGQYVFTDLAEGDVIVELDASNFAADGPLAGLWASTGSGVSTDPNDDVDQNSDGAQGDSVRSGIVSLRFDTEPLAEVDESPTDNDSAFSNLTVDFGVYANSVDVTIDLPDGVAAAAIEAGTPAEIVVTDDRCNVVPGSDGEPIGETLDATGSATIDGVPDGTMHIALPGDNFVDGAALDGVLPGADSSVIDDCVVSAPLSVRAGATASQVTEVALAIDLFAGATVTNTIWNDLDGDGVRDATEPGLSDVEVRLLDETGVVVDSGTSDSAGSQSFADLLPDTYTVQVIVPDGMIVTTRDAGTDDAVDSDIDVSTGQTSIVVTEGDLSQLGIGLRQPTPVTTLPVTGGDSGVPLAGGLGLAVIGLVLLRLARRERFDVAI